MLLIIVIAIVQFAASAAFYEAIDRQTLHEDHARRVAELLVISARMESVDPRVAGRIMTTSHLHATVSAIPVTPGSDWAADVGKIRHLILQWEPMLAEKKLLLGIERGPNRRLDLVGSMLLSNGAWLNFRSQDIASSWPIALRATLMSLLITLICLAAGLYAVHFLTAPLRRLSLAADMIGNGPSLALRETGPSDVRKLTRSFNDMQSQIAGLVSEQAKSFEAISHDLRTPLSRLKIAADFVADGEISQIVSSSANEMEALLMSLQAFLYAQHLMAEPEPFDLVAMTSAVLAPFGNRVRLQAPPRAELRGYREPMTLALRPLVENAIQFADRVEISIAAIDSQWVIEIADDGAGIDEAFFESILDPFFRLDDSRPRNTAGFGLGIPTAHRLMQRYGGRLAFRNADSGGLVVSIHVPATVP